jgi:hypothetical protein
MGRSDYDALELVITNEHAACVHQLLALAEVRARLHDPAAMEQVLLLAIHNEVPGLIEDLARFATMHQLLLQPRIAPFFLSAVATRQYVNAGLLLIHSDARRLLRQVDIEGRNAFDIARNDQPMLDLLRRAWNALDRPEEANQDDEEEEDESKSEQ